MNEASPSADIKVAFARFVPPHGDKHYSFQVLSSDLPSRGDFIVAMKDPVVRAVEPYLQGHDGYRWAMVEFWTKDEAAALSAAQTIATRFGWTLRQGDFTREEAMSL